MTLNPIKLYRQWLYNRDYKRGYAEARKDVNNDGYNWCFEWSTCELLIPEFEYTQGEIDGYKSYLKKFHDKFIAR